MPSAIYFVLPTLVEQPTWGGQYIATSKSLSLPDLKIGQSFELAKDSWVVALPEAPQGYQLLQGKNLTKHHWPETAESLQALLLEDPTGWLGQAADQAEAFSLLIKFTQAKNNSYQVHVRPGNEFDHWLPKPESWYFLQPGQATLGLHPNTSVAEYQERATAIDTVAHQISDQIKAGKVSVAEGRAQLQTAINADHPRRFVNQIEIPTGSIIDLSMGGIHHSWEANEALPQGNIVYEVQRDVRDEFCTLRSFDQGQIKDDGTVRDLHIDSYFQALDTRPEFNVPERYLNQPQAIDEMREQLFDTPYYVTHSLTLAPGQQYELRSQYHGFVHLYAESSPVRLHSQGQTWVLPAGSSVVVPASTPQLQLAADAVAKVLITML